MAAVGPQWGLVWGWGVRKNHADDASIIARERVRFTGNTGDAYHDEEHTDRRIAVGSKFAKVDDRRKRRRTRKCGTLATHGLILSACLHRVRQVDLIIMSHWDASRAVTAIVALSALPIVEVHVGDGVLWGMNVWIILVFTVFDLEGGGQSHLTEGNLVPCGEPTSTRWSKSSW